MHTLEEIISNVLISMLVKLLTTKGSVALARNSSDVP
jgi:hypothetical protein